MATLTIPNVFSAGTSAVASEVNANFTAIKNFIDTNLVQIDGTVKAGAAAVENLGVSNLTSSAINFLAPTGSIIAFGGTTAPTGYVLCDGTEYPIGVIGSTYYSLYGILSTSYNTGGETAGYFRVPNLKGRVPFGLDSADSDFNQLSDRGGSKASVATHQHNSAGLSIASENTNHTHSADGDLTAAGVGNHQHSYLFTNNELLNVQNAYDSGGLLVSSYSGYATDPAGAHSHDVTGNTGYASANSIHNHAISGDTAPFGTSNGNIPPYLTVNYIIKL